MRRVISCLLIGILAGFPVQGVWAQDGLTAEQTEEFRALTQLGGEKFEAGEYDAAAQAFIDAYAIRPVSNILYNVGRIYEQAGRLQDALTYFERFVKSANVEQESRADALERIQTIKGVLALEEQEAAGEEEEEVVVTESPGLQPNEPDRTLAYVFLASGVVALGTSAVFGVLASSEYDSFESASTLQDRKDAASSGTTYSLVSDSLLISGVILASVGTVLFFTAKPSESGVAIAPYVGQREAGLGLSWRY